MTKLEDSYRADSILKINDNLFKVKVDTYQQQFSGIYRKRLQTLWPTLAKSAGKKWISTDNAISIVDKISNTIEGQGSIVIGTVFVSQTNKPSILEELSKSQWEDEKPLSKSYISDSQKFYLEDESGRFEISFRDLPKNIVIVTGMVIATLGTVNGEGVFEAIDVVFPGFAKQKASFQSKTIDYKITDNGNTKNKTHENTNGKLVALVSGLGINLDSSKGEFRRQMLVDYICGQLGSVNSKNTSSRITNLIIAGNSIDSNSSLFTKNENLNGEHNESQPDFDFIYEKLSKLGLEKTNDAKFQDTIVESKSEIEILDEYLSQLNNCVNILLMPGETDPANSTMPQQELHADIILPISNEKNSLHSTTNPTSFEIDGISFLGTSGQNVTDISKCVEGPSLIEIAYSNVLSRIIAPTGPDTLATYPSQNHDPFVLNSSPNVYFVGNMPYFDSKVFKDDNGVQILIILVPKFTISGEMVVLDLEHLSTQLISF
ncbi:DNA polymerase delta small subunit [Smittium mucronatum]|uniref:DNA polymerase delta small subunit n=1 Tax=Smittium mucronatum TaxID=133383 RepID=A0A1R0GSG8_9FUNG|nr:DNA polymerase delta small subunit [Smittium mucronatum]